MNRIAFESLGPAGWRAGLADPWLHWKRGRSAWELAVSWESRRVSASGLPPEIELAFTTHAVFVGAVLLLGIPEHRVTLDDPKRPSQSDLWAMLRTPRGLASMSIEAKAGEEFDRRVGDWLGREGEGKEKRLAFLSDCLGLTSTPPRSIRYQLLHRTASAVLEAKRWGAPLALMLVQSFAESPTSWQDYADFAGILGLNARRGGITESRQLGEIELHLAWVDSPLADDGVASQSV